MTPSTPACIHRVIDGGIQEFVLTEVSRRAVDGLFDITENNLRQVNPSDNPDLIHPVLIDSSVGVQSLNYSMIRLRGMMGKFPERRQGLIAIIMPVSPLVRSIAMLMRPIAPIRMYKPNERDQALAWLHESMAAKR